MKVYVVMGYDEYTRENWLVSVYRHKTDADKHVEINESKEPGENYYVNQMQLLDSFNDLDEQEDDKC